MTERIIRFAGLPAVPWRNGAGTTRGLAADVPGDGWGWRLSVADVGAPGPFSAFPGVERILTVVEGPGLALSVGGQSRVAEKFRPVRFDGGAATECALPEGPVQVLNLMTGPAFHGQVVIVELSGKRPQHLFGGQTGVLLKGAATAELPGTDPVPLGRLDAVRGDEEAPARVAGRGFLAVVSVDPAPGP
jgi:environmental stress-induced protein Ves